MSCPCSPARSPAHVQLVRCVQARHPQGLLSEPAIATIAAAVLSALAYLHSVGYMHRDVKVSLAEHLQLPERKHICSIRSS